MANVKEGQLTEQQEVLLESLISGTKWRDALDAAGYKSSTTKSDILRSANFRKALTDHLEGVLAFNGPEAIKAMEDVMEDPNSMGSAIKLKAATEFLDRSGLGKINRDKPEEATVNHVFILPPKDPED